MASRSSPRLSFALFFAVSGFNICVCCNSTYTNKANAMLELLSLALFVVAVVAINKANGAIKENTALRAELERIRLHLEGKPAFKEDDSRHHPAADAGEVSNL